MARLTPTPLPPDVSEMMQLWNSKMGAASKQIELLESLIPHDRKEMALTLFHENDYKINGKLFGDKYEELNISRPTSYDSISSFAFQF